MGRPDERDTVFYRSRLQPGSEAYDLYYLHHPDLEMRDADMRTDVIPEFDTDSVTAKAAAAHFSLLRHLRTGVQSVCVEKRLDFDLTYAMIELQSIAYSYGAISFGACEAKESYYYEHRARGSLDGEAPTRLPNALVYAVEMDADLAHAAPAPPQQIAVAIGYVRVAIIGLVIAAFIRSFGYNADPI